MFKVDSINICDTFIWLNFFNYCILNYFRKLNCY